MNMVNLCPNSKKDGTIDFDFDDSKEAKSKVVNAMKNSWC